MIEGKSVLAIVPARGGSKGLPGKNVMPVGGKPLIAWTIAAAKASQHIDRVILSSEDPAIIDAARAAGCEVPFVRPAELASDEARVEDAVLHALDSIAEQYDLLVLLQPTSPLRRGEDIDGCLAAYLNRRAGSAMSVCEPSKSPYWMFRMDDEDRLDRLLPLPEGGHRRQNLPSVYAPNGAVYVIGVETFRKTRAFVTDDTVGYVMPVDRSIDIDTPMDMALFKSVVADGATPSAL